MNRLSDADIRLAAQVERLLAEQPTPDPPADLAARVLAGIERRGSRPWWRRSVREWPWPARLAFAAAGCALAVLLAAPWGGALPATPLDTGRLSATLAHHTPLYQSIASTTASLGRALAALAGSIPGPLLRGGLALGALAYITLFGLLAAVFRLPRTLSKDHP